MKILIILNLFQIATILLIGVNCDRNNDNNSDNEYGNNEPHTLTTVLVSNEPPNARDRLNFCTNGIRMIQSEYATFGNSFVNILEGYETLPDSCNTITQQLNLREYLINATKMIDNKVRSIEGALNLKSSNLETAVQGHKIDATEAIKKGDYCAARYKLLENGEYDFPTLIPSVYGTNLTNAEKLVSFLNTLPDKTDTIYGFRILFDEMKKNGHHYSTVTSMIAYQVLNVLHETLNHNEHFIHIRDNLPGSYNSLKWNMVTAMNNKINNEPSYGSSDKDTLRRIVYTYYTACGGTHCQWKFIPEPNGEYFYIRNHAYPEYMYADTKDFAFDNQRRSVFLRKKDEPIEMGKWQVEPIEGSEYFKIKNVFWNEYLYLDSTEYRLSVYYGNVYTWRPGGCNQEGCKWKFVKA